MTENATLEIVLTGGPCAGKTTALRYLNTHLTARGVRVLIVPEAATMLITGGIADIGHLAANHRAAYLDVQRNLFGLQADLRARYRRLGEDLHARTGQRVVILYDRAELDNRAYMTTDEFADVIAERDLSIGQLAAQYDAVIHLVTAADGAPDAYSTANNEARTETPEQAIEADHTTLVSWMGHAHLVVINNDGTFDHKLRRTLAAVLNLLGDPDPVEIERKYALHTAPDLTRPDLAHAVAVEIEQQYLRVLPGEPDRRIRSITYAGHTSYFHTIKATRAEGGRIEIERQISPETYTFLSDLRDPGTSVVRKTRYHFAHGSQHFELDHIHEPRELWLLEAEIIDANDTVQPPPFLGPVDDVTDDPAWKNATIARTPA